MLDIAYFNTLGRAHDHPKQRQVRFTPAEKVEILTEFSTQHRDLLSFDLYAELPWGSTTSFKKQLHSGELGSGHEELKQAIATRAGKFGKRKAHEIPTTSNNTTSI